MNKNANNFYFICEYLSDIDIINLSLVKKNFLYLKCKLKKRYIFDFDKRDLFVKYKCKKLRVKTDDIIKFNILRKNKNYTYFSELDDIMFDKNVFVSELDLKLISLTVDDSYNRKYKLDSPKCSSVR